MGRELSWRSTLLGSTSEASPSDACNMMTSPSSFNLGRFDCWSSPAPASTARGRYRERYVSMEYRHDQSRVPSNRVRTLTWWTASDAEGPVRRQQYTRYASARQSHQNLRNQLTRQSVFADVWFGEGWRDGGGVDTCGAHSFLTAS